MLKGYTYTYIPVHVYLFQQKWMDFIGIQADHSLDYKKCHVHHMCQQIKVKVK